MGGGARVGWCFSFYFLLLQFLCTQGHRQEKGGLPAPRFQVFIAFYIAPLAEAADGHPGLFSWDRSASVAAGVKPRASSGFSPQRGRGCGGHFFLTSASLVEVLVVFLLVVAINHLLLEPASHRDCCCVGGCFSAQARQTGFLFVVRRRAHSCTPDWGYWESAVVGRIIIGSPGVGGLAGGS